MNTDAKIFLMSPFVTDDEVDGVKDVTIERLKAAIRPFDPSQTEPTDAGSPEATENDEEDYNRQGCIEEAIVNGDPRFYQISLFERAKERNTIVHLGTGLGKTLIGILCIKHFSTSYDEGKQTLFLTPSVALAVQHTLTLKANLPYKVATACHTNTHSSSARKKLQQANIMVATHGAALDLFFHYGDLFNMENVNLLVIDECHNAHGNHGYARIMDIFYHSTKAEKRPHVLGLTASPLVNVRPQIKDEGLDKLILSLEQKLDSELVSLSRLGLSGPNVGLKVKCAEEILIKYCDEAPSQVMPSQENIGLHESRCKEMIQLQNLYEELGPRVTSTYCKTLLKEISRNRYDKESPRQFERLLSFIRFLVKFFDDQCIIKNDGLTDKVTKLENLLKDIFCGNNSSEIVGVVFVERRITAFALYEYCRKHLKSIKFDIIIRQPTSIFKYLHSSHKISTEDQKDLENEWLHQVKNVRDILHRLRSKQTNVLIATSVVEEGVDVDACSFVVCFDNITTSKGYIQMKGRARKQNAKFIVFENIHPFANKPPITLMEAQEVEQRVNSFIKERKNIVNNLHLVKRSAKCESPFSCMELKALHEQEYYGPNGCVDLLSAKSLLYRYALSIPCDHTTRSSRQAMMLHLPVYDGFVLTLPSHLPRNIRVVTLPEEFQNVRESKKKIQHKLALMACVRLHNLKLINDRLLPLKNKDMKLLLSKMLPTKFSCLQGALVRIETPKVEETNEFYVYSILQKGEYFAQNNEALKGGSRRLCVITVTGLTRIPAMVFFHNELGTVNCELKGEVSMILTKEEWDLTSKFYECIFDARWRRRTGRKKIRIALERKRGVVPPYVIGLWKNDKIDWDGMKTTIMVYNRNEKERKAAVNIVRPEEFSKPRLWVPIYDPNVTYVCVSGTELNTSAPFPHDEKCDTYRDYIEHKRGFKLKRHSSLFAVQRIWQLPQKMQIPNFSENISSKSCKGHDFSKKVNMGEKCILFGLETALLPQDACMEAPIADAALCLHCIFLPQILYEIERHLVAILFTEYCKTNFLALGQFLDKTRIEHIIETLTAKSCSLSINYDRLEYLGDAVLKMIQTDGLIKSKDMSKWVDHLHEGDLSSLRSLMGCNSRLRTAAVNTGIDEFILCTPLGRGTWVPIDLEFYIIEDGMVSGERKESSEILKEFRPSTKVCADVIEALIGLVYLNFGYEASTKIVIELGLSFTQENMILDGEERSPSIMRQDCIEILRNFLNQEEVHRPELMKEALTHPSCVHEDVPCYQKLEWIGDAVLCLAARECVFKQYPSFEVSHLVSIETILVCNETLAYLGFTHDIHKLINHRDSDLPRRFEEYEKKIAERKVLWRTDPPKIISDVVEALLGSIHVSEGLKKSTQTSLHILQPILTVIFDEMKTAKDVLNNIEASRLIHPKQVFHEYFGKFFKVKSHTEVDFALKHPKCPVWVCKRWRLPNRSSNKIIGQIVCGDANLLAVAESTVQEAKNAVCALFTRCWFQSPELMKLTSDMNVEKKKG